MKQKHTGTAIKRTRGDVVFDVINALLLLIVMLVVAYPLVYAISCSFSSPLLVVQSKVYLLPKGLTTIAYERVFNNHQILTGYKNTVFYTLLGTAINIILTTMTAYPLSRRDFKARKFITFLFTFTMLFSGGLIPTFLVVRNLGLMNTVWALILPGAISSWNMFIMKNYFQTSIPGELYEAARIDGAGRWKQTLHVTIPGILPTIIIMLILAMGRIMNVSFQKILLMMNGGNQSVADVISTYVYRRGIQDADFSYATGVNLFQSLVSLLFVIGTNTISRKFSETSLW